MADQGNGSFTVTTESPANRREKDREKTGLEQKHIPLKTQERLARDGQRQIRSEEQNQRDHRPETEQEQDRHDGACATKKVQESITRVEPAKSGQKDQSLVTEMLTRGRQVVGDR